MATEREKMVAGEPYLPADPELVAARVRARELTGAFTNSSPSDPGARRRILESLFASVGPNVEIEPPFFCDYGTNITLGEKVFLNFNCVILDVCAVRIGAFTQIGPAVQIYTASHPLDAAERRRHEFGKPVEIGDDVWIGGGAIILPGVRIGSGAVIGAGSVVTKDVPERVLAAGNPCRVIRSLADG